MGKALEMYLKKREDVKSYEKLYIKTGAVAYFKIPAHIYFKI